MGKNKQLFINLITTLLVLVINIFINFGLSRYIVDNIGQEAYGFISLANNFISYATIFTAALNSMGSRFITIDIHNKKIESANKFFSSLIIANFIIILFLIIPAIIIIAYLEYIVNIPVEIVLDVKLLFTFIFLNFFATLVGGVFTVATYCKNKIYLSSIKNMESSLLKMGIIIILFILFEPAVFYVGIATLIATIYIVLFNIKFTRKLLPEIKIDKKFFSIKKIKILLSSGLWNSITSLGNVLADGLDLIISNLAIDAATMGIVAIAKVPGNVLNTVLSNISNVFQPQIIGYYAKNDIDGVVKEAKKGMKISGMFGNIPFCYILIFGTLFCKVWMPSVDNVVLTIICIITFINVYTGGIISPLYNIFTITNRVKYNSILNILSGVVSTVIVFILLNTTNLGVYVIVGVSAFIGLFKGFIIVPIYCAKSLNTNVKTFFPTLIKYIFATLVIILSFGIIRLLLVPNNWIMLCLSILMCGIIGLIINYIVLLEKEDKAELKNIFLKKFKIRS